MIRALITGLMLAGVTLAAAVVGTMSLDVLGEAWVWLIAGCAFVAGAAGDLTRRSNARRSNAVTQ